MEVLQEINSKKQLIPILRFNGFNENWITKTLKEFTKINQGLQIAISERLTEMVDGSHFYITNEFLKEGSKKTYYIMNPSESVICNEEDILMTRTGNTGQVVTGVKGAFHNNFFKIKFDSTCDRLFLYYFLTSYKIQHTILKLAGTSTIPDLNHGDFYKIKINLPSFPEQQKVASFLSAVDEKIQLLTRKKELLEQYKKGVMQQLFSGKLRFKDENGKEYPEWEEKNGNLIFDSISDKKHNSDLPILAITQEHGAIPRDLIDYSISVTDKSIETYKVVQNGDFIISLRSFQGGIEYSNYKGICSPAYVILRPKVSLNRLFFKYYFKTENYIKLLNKRLEGIRDGKMISYKYFSETKLPLPSIEEQNKIVDFLNSIESKSQILNNQLTQTQTFKKGLLQQMFV